MLNLVPNYAVQPEDGRVYAMTDASSVIPSPLDYSRALDYSNQEVVSPNDRVFNNIYGAKADTSNANVKQAEPIKTEVVVTREVPVFDFKKLLIFGVIGFIGYKLLKKGRA